MQVLTGRGIVLIFALGFILAIGLLVIAPTPAPEEAAQTPDPPAIAEPGDRGRICPARRFRFEDDYN